MMCRYDDGDYDWYVDSTDNAAVSDKATECEDCGRPIKAGEIHTVFTAMEVEDDGDEYLFAAQYPRDAGHSVGPVSADWRGHGRLWVRESEPYVVIDEDDSEVWEALGFVVGEVENEKVPTYHHSCAQCVIANRWLEKICGQHTVMVTVVDLAAHVDEYDPETLGPDFMRLYGLAQHQWQTPSPLTGGTFTVGVGWVRATVELAIEHAITAGLQEAH